MNKQIDTIILHSRWGFYTSGERFSNNEGGKNLVKTLFF